MRASSTVAAAFEQAGFVLVRSNRHSIWRCPCGHAQLVGSKTPGRGRAAQNTVADIARTLKACRRRASAAA